MPYIEAYMKAVYRETIDIFPVRVRNETDLPTMVLSSEPRHWPAIRPYVRPKYIIHNEPVVYERIRKLYGYWAMELMRLSLRMPCIVESAKYRKGEPTDPLYVQIVQQEQPQLSTAHRSGTQNTTMTIEAPQSIQPQPKKEQLEAAQEEQQRWAEAWKSIQKPQNIPQRWKPVLPTNQCNEIQHSKSGTSTRNPAVSQETPHVRQGSKPNQHMRTESHSDNGTSQRTQTLAPIFKEANEQAAERIRIRMMDERNKHLD